MKGGRRGEFMLIFVTEDPAENSYVGSLISQYQNTGHEVVCGAGNFFHSNLAPDILHLHWTERLYDWHFSREVAVSERFRILEERLKWFKSQGTTIVKTVHNLFPLDVQPKQDSLDAFSLLIRYADVLVHHCERSVKLLEDRYEAAKGKKVVICPHGDYLVEYKKVDKKEARRFFGIPDDKIVILNFGKQRPYKNESFILDVFKQVTSPKKHLFIAGKFVNSTRSSTEKWYYTARNNIRQRFPYGDRKYIYEAIPAANIPHLLTCADMLFLGQSTSLNSGALVMAATYGIPVVCGDVGCYREAVSDWVCEIFEPENTSSASDAVNRMVERISAAGFAAQLDNRRWLDNNSWKLHADRILASVAKP